MKDREKIDWETVLMTIMDHFIRVEQKLNKILEVLPQSKEEWDTKIEQTVRAILDTSVRDPDGRPY